MNIPAVLLKLGPIALRAAKLVVVVAPHVIAIYQYRKETKLLNNKEIPK